jgi:hypothetical protein
VMVTPNRCVVVDSRIRLHRAEPTGPWPGVTGVGPLRPH